MKAILYFIILMVTTSLHGMQEGLLSFKNVLEHAIRIRYETNLTGTLRGNTFKNNVCSNSGSNPQEWEQINPKESIVAQTWLRIYNKCAWGQTVDVQIYQPNNGQIAHFIVSKILVYSIIARDKAILLHNDEQNVTVFPQPNK